MSKFDFSKLKKFDIQGMVESVKSIINPEVPIPPGMENDPIVAKLMMLKAEVQNFTSVLEQQQQVVGKMNTLMASILKDLETLKKVMPTAATPTAPAETQAPEEEHKENK